MNTTTKVIVLPSGRSVTLGEYVRSWRTLKGLPAETSIDRWEWYPVSASRVLSAIRYGVHDRINKRGGISIPDMQTPKRQTRFFNRAKTRANVHCKYCGVPIAFNNIHPRACAACR